MKCPACNNDLQKIQSEGVKLDICTNGCGGMWFDNTELQKVDEKNESAGEHILRYQNKVNISPDHTHQIICPRCENQKMVKHFMSVKHKVEVDECYNCGGYWLDIGELAEIREQFDTDEHRQQAATKYFDDVFGEKIKQMQLEEQEKLQKVKRIVHWFRYLCPSYYIPGKQDWGAY